MKAKETVKETLEKWGFPLLQENGNSMVFRYQMNYVQINVTGDEENPGLAVTLSGVFSADNEKEMILGLRTCNDLNYNLMQVKLYIDSDSDLIIASEHFPQPGTDMEMLLTMALNMVVSAKKKFLQRYRQIEEETELMSELESEE